MNTKQLRQKILDLAIRGKLVPQDPNDEPASVLLEKIRAEKERLIKEKKIKRDKNYFSNSSSGMSHYQNVPFSVPEGWVWVKLEDIAFLKAGFFVKADDISKEYHENLFPCYGGNGLRGYVTTFTHEGLYSLIGRQGALCGNINLVHGKFHATEHAIVTSLYTKINSIWMFYVLKALNLNQYAIGAAQPGLSVERINKVLCPLPPFPEQQRIVSVVQKVFALIDEIDSNKLSLQQFIKQSKSKVLDLAIRGKLVPQDPDDEPASALLERIKNEQKTKKTTADIFPYPFEIPENWVWCKLGEINNIARGGSPRPIKDYLTNSEDGINWIKIGDTKKGEKYIFSTQEKIIREGIRYSRLVNIDDFLLTNSMSFGRPYILKTSGCIHDGWLVISIEKELLDIDFMYYLLRSDFMYNQFFNTAVGSTVKNLKIESVQQIPFPIPPLFEQQRIVQKIETVFTELDTIEDNL